MKKISLNHSEEEFNDDFSNDTQEKGVYFITPRGASILKDEYTELATRERPELLKVIEWAAGNGDRSENGDYIYAKKKLREIDKRIGYLTGRLNNIKVIDPCAQKSSENIQFGATVTIVDDSRI